MIKKIAHISDIHIRKLPTRNKEYEFVFNNLFKSLKEQNPDRIVIVGDLVHNYLDLQGEQLILASKFLNKLAEIAPTIITRGNHDFRRKNSKRVDSVAAIVKTINNPNITYYNKTGFYTDDNIIWAVWHHGEKNNNPWKTKEGKKINAYNDNNDFTTIDLFHDPINGCKSTTGFEMKKKSYYKISEFKGNNSFLGDIHLQQSFNNNTKAYAGSLIAQDFSEGDDQFHGYLLWELNDNLFQYKKIPVHNNWSFKNIKLTPFTDFNDLDLEIENPTKFMKIRIIWGTLPSTRNKENERKIVEYFKSLYKEQIISITHKNEFVEDDTIDINEDITVEDITDQTVQHEIFKEYLDKIGIDEKMIADIIALDDEISSRVEIESNTNIEWDVVKFGAYNFMSYENIDIDWRDKDGLYQITGINTAGKTTILKILSYTLFSKTLETESRKKYGDSRFVNNKTGVDYCTSYMVLVANGEYYGIKRRTDISRNKNGEINGASTKVYYYLLSSPDDEMNDDNSINNLTEDNKNNTQKKIDEIVGSYDNYMRVAMTTSDTLNRILSNDMAIFTDSLLFDSGLDIFDKKLNIAKEYQKEINTKFRITCNVELTEEKNNNLEEHKKIIKQEIKNIEETLLPDVKNKIIKGQEYIEHLTKKLYKIDDEIATLNVNQTNDNILLHDENIEQLESRKKILINAIKPLKEKYDEQKLNDLIEKKDKHKGQEYDINLEIKTLENKIREEEHNIEIINGKIYILKQDGTENKIKIKKLKESKVCPTCGQVINEKEHQKHINDEVSKIEKEMYEFRDRIINHESDIENINKVEIQKYNDKISTLNEKKEKMSLEMEKILKDIGKLTNDKNDVEKRTAFQAELDQIPTKIQNEELKKSILEKKIKDYNDSLEHIQENIKINKGIDAAKVRLKELLEEEKGYDTVILNKNHEIKEIETTVLANKKLITDFKAQEYQDSVINTYKKCVHRDGIPRQMLTNYVIPKVNEHLRNMLSNAPFKVWLDIEDLRPKLSYYNTPDAIIDAISSSGKERTFSSIVLKVALNEINVKSKPTIFLLDEVMGKLTEESVEEFVEILHIIKEKCKKIIIIEHNADVNPDYIITATRNELGISNAEFE